MRFRFILIIAVVLAALAAIFILQLYMIESFRSYHPEMLGKKTTEAGWCMLFTCEKISYPTMANITEPSLEIGFDVGPEDLKFGAVPVGGGGKRFLNIKNDGETRARVNMVSFGNISSYIQFEPKDFDLAKGESAEVKVLLKTEAEMQTGLYSGDITLIRLSPKHELFDFLMGWV